MRVLFVIPEYPPSYGGGIATYYGTLLPELAAQGMEVTAVVGSSLSEGPAPALLDGVKIIPLDRSLLLRLKPSFATFALAPDFAAHLAGAWAAWEQTNGGQGYDVVECSDWGLLFVPWIVADAAPPVLVRMHASIGQIGRYDPQDGHLLAESLAALTEDTLLPHATSLATYGRANQSDWTYRLRREVGYVPPAYESGSMGEMESVRNPGGLVVGRVQSWKGPEVLCKAVARLGRDAPNIDWVGRDMPFPNSKGTMGSRLKRDYPGVWGKKIRHHHPLPPEEVYQRQATSSFVVVPSDWDVFNLGAIEAMSAGAVVICSTGAGAADLIQDGENGFSFPAGDDAALASCLQKVAKLTDVERNRIGIRARETTKTELSPRDIAARHSDQLLGACSISRSPVPSDRRRLFSPSECLSLNESGLARLPIRELGSQLGERLLNKLHRSK